MEKEVNAAAMNEHKLFSVSYYVSEFQWAIMRNRPFLDSHINILYIMYKQCNGLN